MKHPSALLLSIALVSCATAPSTAPVAATVASAGSTPCPSAIPSINGVLWQQSAAEYQAVTRSVYSSAKRTLQAALDDPKWTAATEQTGEFSALPPAVILDLDETALDTSWFQTHLIDEQMSFSEDEWHRYAMRDSSRPIPAALEFLKYAQGEKVAIFYITNRVMSEEPALRATLERYGFPLDSSHDNLLSKGKKPDWSTSDKTSRRAFVASQYRVLMLFGDDLNDFYLANGKSAAERDAIVSRYADNWGVKWFALPNPIYGSWERALLGDTKGDCNQKEQKLRSLRRN